MNEPWWKTNTQNTGNQPESKNQPTDTELLELVDKLISGDIGFAADNLIKELATDKEKKFAKLITQIYRIIHPRFSTCKHPDWNEETRKLIKNVKIGTKKQEN